MAPKSEPGEILATVTTGDVDFVYESHVHGETVSDFEAGMAIAAMLRREVLHVNDRWWRADLPEDVRSTTVLFVLCNDVFAWGCAESEPLPYSEVENLYRMWRKDPVWGTDVWCCQQREEMPQYPVAKMIREAGVWDLSSMGLAENAYDRMCRELFGKK